MNSQIRILIVDDYPAVRMDLHTVLELMEGVQVVGETATGQEAFRLAETTRPDIILIDLDMDRHQPAYQNGCDIISRMRVLAPQARIIALSNEGGPAIWQPALSAGADAAFVKGLETDRFLDQIRYFLGKKSKGKM
jgi:NarL family two-component system response regulator LiaR